MMADEGALTTARIAELGEQYGRRNAARGVTGFLLCTPPFFLQCLEGPPQEVKEVFLKIYRDPHRVVAPAMTSQYRSRGGG